MKFSKIVLIVIFITTIIFMAINIVFFFYTGEYMEQAWHDWMQYIFGEGLILGFIKIAKEAGATVDKSRIQKELAELKKMAENEAGKET